MQGAGGVGGLLSETFISNPQSPISYPTYDGNGNVSEYLTTSGSVAAHFEYDPFGNTVVNTDTGNQFTYKFSTKPADSETGLYYYGYRYYDPFTGRWPSRDPIEEKGGVNLYGFLVNDGVYSEDFLGLKTCYRWMLITFFNDSNGKDGKSESGHRDQDGTISGKDLDDGDAADAWVNHPIKPMLRPYGQGTIFRVHRGSKGIDNRVINDAGVGFDRWRPGLPGGVPPDMWLDLWDPNKDKNPEWDIVDTSVEDKCPCPEGWTTDNPPPEPKGKSAFDKAKKEKADQQEKEADKKWHRTHPGK